MMIKRNKIPTIIGMLILLGGVFAGVFLLRNNQIFKIGANPTTVPKDVRISNLSDTSATVSWVTEDSATSFISYGKDSKVGSLIYESDNSEKYYTHSITITGLLPETSYYFKINSNGSTYDNNGVPWQFTTGQKLNINKTSIPVSGSLITASGEPSNRAIVYVTIGGYVASTLTSESGTFVIQLGLVRTTDLSSYLTIDPAKTLLEISAITESGETATAKIFPQSANPVPTLMVGKDQDFRNLEPSADGQNPGADLSIPEDSTKSSKFDVSGYKIASSTGVTLDSIDEGETVTSDQPQFFGDGPRGEQITITVHSDTAVTGKATVSSTGSWSWSPPSDLSPGTHTITLSWIDASGITRTLTRNFVVQAGELPAFVASGSATPTATPKASTTPSATPVKTATPTPKASNAATASATPKIVKTPAATSASLPSSGSLIPTIIMFMMGIGILTFSLYIWKGSKEL